MNYRKMFWTVVWLLMVVIAALGAEYIPADLMYAYGFGCGSFCMIPLRLRGDE